MQSILLEFELQPNWRASIVACKLPVLSALRRFSVLVGGRLAFRRIIRRKATTRASLHFPQGNAEGRDSGARESWLEDERAIWVLCVFVGRLDFCTHIMVPICCPVDNVAFWFSGEVFEELAELKCQTRIVEEVPEALAQSASPRASCLFSARYVRAPFPFLFVAQA